MNISFANFVTRGEPLSAATHYLKTCRFIIRVIIRNANSTEKIT